VYCINIITKKKPERTSYIQMSLDDRRKRGHEDRIHTIRKDLLCEETTHFRIDRPENRGSFAGLFILMVILKNQKKRQISERRNPGGKKDLGAPFSKRKGSFSKQGSAVTWHVLAPVSSRDF